ncbi:2-C-methyl-D-erythritol 4-phosphate cytidylyltransferase [Priestia koreensis]|uniref:2-C-methyl-D-erythritol 4-phosphate cytidylyltransferase n=1 Tax=Priestia koreensis TaxID=284581 RepID=UPI001F56E399|nr:2-C-methyl-D-erythritol 4-phosphate cytidylyltransferase [Priestia koreensis]MCM3006804.1 2-C-methyl-D-erythritol 4-phosphate cytidylyltransferase [Priestia koreensis]UNL85112.1 2-C-methyl-D-erythritol 4-phosphate cytidylyltransferase [Priestia koreensis]
MKYRVIIPAAGQGKRMNAGKNKQFIELDGVPVIIHTLRVFDADPLCDGIILVVNEQDQLFFQHLISEYGVQKISEMVIGGQERQHSVYNGLQKLQDHEVVLIHDGARPFVEQDKIHELVDVVQKEQAAVLAVQMKDTVKRAVDGYAVETVERSSLWSVQTPQAFLVPVIQHAHEVARQQGFLGTDDASLVEYIGEKVAIVEGRYHNIKLTTQEDLLYAEAILNSRQ